MAENTEIWVKEQQDGIMSENPYPAVFEPFADLLRKRFEGEICTNEDCIRYCFFSVLLNRLGISPNEIILESPFSDEKGDRKKLDFYVPATSERDGLVVEFKYDRNNTDHGKATTRQAGQLFADINRLAHFNNNNGKIKRYFVYATDEEMLKYLRNTRNRLEWFIDAKKDIPDKIDPCHLKTLSKTVQKNAGDIESKIPFKLVHQMNHPNHIINIYEILPEAEDQ